MREMLNRRNSTIKYMYFVYRVTNNNTNNFEEKKRKF